MTEKPEVSTMLVVRQLDGFRSYCTVAACVMALVGLVLVIGAASDLSKGAATIYTPFDLGTGVLFFALAGYLTRLGWSSIKALDDRLVICNLPVTRSISWADVLEIRQARTGSTVLRTRNGKTISLTALSGSPWFSAVRAHRADRIKELEARIRAASPLVHDAQAEVTAQVNAVTTRAEAVD